MAAWNVTICSSASSLLKMNSKNRVEQVLGMVPSPQVSPSTIRGGMGELYNNGEQQGGCGAAGLSPKRGYYAAFEQMADEEMMVEEEEIVGGAGGVVMKKRRLSVDQVRFLESSFESENKLEPERKVQIAQRLGLQPRQVAVWFQNRRARSKSKQLERDFLALKADYHAVLLENEKLQAEVDRLTAQLMREGSVPVEGGGHTEAGAKHVLKESKTSGSSSSNNCANSEGPTLKVEAADHEASTASGDDVRGNELTMGGDGDEEQLSPCTILADVNVSVSGGGGRAKAGAVAASESATSTYEEIHFLTNCMQQAYAHQLLDFYTDYDNNFFITSSLDDPWISDS